MTKMQRMSLALAATLSLIPLVSCGGGGGDTATAATTIGYTDPSGVTGTAYYATKNTSLSTNGHLVLDIHGPSTVVNGCGVVLTLSADQTKVTWANVNSGDPAGTYVANGAVLSSPIVKGKLLGGNVLQVVVAEKGTASPKALNGVLLRVALDIKSGQTKGTSVTVTADTTKSEVLLGTGTPQALPAVTIATLTLQ